MRSSRARGLQILAEKVETYEEFDWARQCGYDYFQGYFFARPVMVRGRQIPAAKLHCLRLLQEAQRPELDFERLETLILEDVSLSYQLLRYVNSPLFALASRIQSIRQALLYFGETELRKWIALATLARTAEDKPSELIRHSLVRARFCESVARMAQQRAGAIRVSHRPVLAAGCSDRPAAPRDASGNAPGARDCGGAERQSGGQRSRWRESTNWRGRTKWPIGGASKSLASNSACPWRVWAKSTAPQPAGRARC